MYIHRKEIQSWISSAIACEYRIETWWKILLFSKSINLEKSSRLLWIKIREFRKILGSINQKKKKYLRRFFQKEEFFLGERKILLLSPYWSHDEGFHWTRKGGTAGYKIAINNRPREFFVAGHKSPRQSSPRFFRATFPSSSVLHACRQRAARWPRPFFPPFVSVVRRRWSISLRIGAAILISVKKRIEPSRVRLIIGIVDRRKVVDRKPIEARLD